MGEAGGQVDVGEYERQRLQHIRRNREEIMRLGVSLIGYSKPSTSTSTSTSARGKGVKNSKKRQRDKGEVRLPTRKSSRLLGKEAEYASDDLEVLVKLEEEEGEERKGIKREKEKRNIIEISTQWLEESRKALLQVRVESSGGASSNGKWRKEAERRWGHGVVAAEAATSNLCWKTYVTSRLSKPPPPSPLELVQEFYAHDPWRLLVCCILMSRVSSWETKHNAISSFFKAYPTPTDMHNADPKECLSVIHPLGLFENRMKALISLTSAFLSKATFDVDLKENKIYGIGQFGVDSYNIFCKSFIGNPSDKTLKRYVHWFKSSAASSPL